MTGNHLEVLAASGGLIASALGAIAGFSRFRAWWFDRVRQARTESATYLKEKGGAEWEVAMGTEQLRQLHFEALTTIDRSSGHEAIRRCHQRLGGTRNDWERLRNVGPFLIATGHTARVQKPGRRALFRFLLMAAISFGSFLIALFIVGAVGSFVDRTALSSIRLPHVLGFVVAAVWTAALGLLASLAGQYCLQYLNARTLYRELVCLGKVRRAAARSRPRLDEQATFPPESG